MPLNHKVLNADFFGLLDGQYVKLGTIEEIEIIRDEEDLPVENHRVINAFQGEFTCTLSIFKNASIVQSKMYQRHYERRNRVKRNVRW